MINHTKETITQYFASRRCPSCKGPTYSPLCTTCQKDWVGTAADLEIKIRDWERAPDNLKQIVLAPDSRTDLEGRMSIPQLTSVSVGGCSSEDIIVQQDVTLKHPTYVLWNGNRNAGHALSSINTNSGPIASRNRSTWERVTSLQ
ncbi:hypothetical protein TNCV_2039211 [Trichonephila clavipes]|nr:hypothetical protein TNCV_2039211 [Trichonephila clavipes]